MDRDKLAQLRKRKADNKASEHKQLLESNASIKEAITLLSETINGRLDTRIIGEQIASLKKSLTFSSEIKALELSMNSVRSNAFKVKDFDKLLDKVGSINNSGVVEAVNNLVAKLEDNSVSQKAEDFQPVRRVIQVGQRLVFDDLPTPIAFGGGGGGGGSSIPTYLIENERLKVIAEPIGGFAPEDTITTTIDGDLIIQTNGIKTYTVTIDGDNITEHWS